MKVKGQNIDRKGVTAYSWATKEFKVENQDLPSKLKKPVQPLIIHTSFVSDPTDS
jgi:hypothetical protein